jgi:hypothetical protein
MPAIFDAQLSEFGSYYLVTNIFLTEVKYVVPTGKYQPLPNSVALTLKNELNQGKLIKIEKDLIDNPKSKDIPLENFTIEEPKELEMKKSAQRAKVNSRFTAYAATLNALDIFDFFFITTKLNSMGYNVLDNENKEEVFLKIINTGNDDLITDLERFLETKDRFDKISKMRNGIKDYFREIDDCDTDEELEDVIKSNKGWLIN